MHVLIILKSSIESFKLSTSTLPSIRRIITKGYRAMVESDPRLKEVFKKPPMIVYRRPPSLRAEADLSQAQTPGPKLSPEMRDSDFVQAGSAPGSDQRRGHY